MNAKHLLIVLTGVIGSAAACSAPRSAPRVDTPPPVAVTLARAELTEAPELFEAGGVVRARTTAVVSSRIMAPVVLVAVRPGDRVRRGAPLVTLDATELAANRARSDAALASAIENERAADADVDAAAAALSLAQVSYDRTNTLHDKRSATGQELDQARSARDAAAAQLESARARAASARAGHEAARAAADAAGTTESYAHLTAPFDGIVTARTIDPGSMAVPGVALVTIEDPVSFQLEVSVDEARATQILVGSAAEVRIGDDEQDAVTFAGARVTEIARVDPSTHGFVVKLSLPESPALRSGLFGRARFSGPARHRLTVPASAIVRRGQLSFAFAVDAAERARLQPVSVGTVAAGRVEVLAGLNAGDRIVDNPPPSLADGAAIAGDLR